MKFTKYNNPNRRRRPSRVDSYDRHMRKLYTEMYFDKLAKCRTQEERDNIETAYNMAMSSTGTPKAF